MCFLPLYRLVSDTLLEEWTLAWNPGKLRENLETPMTQPIKLSGPWGGCGTLVGLRRSRTSAKVCLTSYKTRRSIFQRNWVAHGQTVSFQVSIKQCPLEMILTERSSPASSRPPAHLALNASLNLWQGFTSSLSLSLSLASGCKKRRGTLQWRRF